MNQQVGGNTVEPTSDQVHQEGSEHGDEAFAHKLVALDQESCVHRFGYGCKTLLNEHPTLINEVIARAERFQNESGGETLLGILNGIKKMRIEHMPPYDRKRLLWRALRRSNPTLAPVLS